jgi:hypothetical protein
MSNKPWRNPANPDYQPPAVDPSTAHSTGSGQAAAPAAGADGAASNDGDSPQNRGQSPLPEPAAFGAGQGYTDLRYPVRGLVSTGLPHERLSDEMALAMLDNCDRFLVQLVTITSRVLETVPLGEVRQLVASEMAMSGAVVKQDGTVLKAKDMPPAAADPAKRPRAVSHPLLTLIRIAVQAVRLLRQIASGTHPEVTRRRAQKITPEQEQAYDKVYNQMGSYLRAT